MINGVFLIGYLEEKPKICEKSNFNSEFKIYSFTLIVERPFLLTGSDQMETDLVPILTYDFNLKKYSNKLVAKITLAINGRIVNKNNKIFVFADTVLFLGKKK